MSTFHTFEVSPAEKRAYKKLMELIDVYLSYDPEPSLPRCKEWFYTEGFGFESSPLFKDFLHVFFTICLCKK